MWKWKCELHELGFHRRPQGLWICESRFGLGEDEHLSLFPDVETFWQNQHLLCFSAFHITFEIFADNVHFYYHERNDNEWEPGGHTSSIEIRRLGQDVSQLRELADGIALRFVEGLRGIWLDRE
jgi:hypothetical protein